MLGSYRVYNADAHVILTPAMWEDLPEKYVPRHPRPATFSDSGKEEIALLGEDQLLYSSDYPHGEARENAAQNLLERKDVTETQKQKILYNNPVRFFGEP